MIATGVVLRRNKGLASVFSTGIARWANHSDTATAGTIGGAKRMVVTDPPRTLAALASWHLQSSTARRSTRGQTCLCRRGACGAHFLSGLLHPESQQCAHSRAQVCEALPASSHARPCPLSSAILRPCYDSFPLTAPHRSSCGLVSRGSALPKRAPVHWPVQDHRQKRTRSRLPRTPEQALPELGAVFARPFESAQQPRRPQRC